MNKVDFQRALGVKPDGIIGPVTVAAFEAAARRPVRHAPDRMGRLLGDAAAQLGVTIAQLRAVVAVETGGASPYDPVGRPTILFERHVFSKETGRIFDARYPVVSNRVPGGYRADRQAAHEWQWTKLRIALALDPAAAIGACSWGALQIMGYHWRVLGYASPHAMVVACAQDVAGQVDAFIRYIRVFGLADELASCRAGVPSSCRAFARAYNGPGFARWGYDRKLARALEQQA